MKEEGYDKLLKGDIKKMQVICLDLFEWFDPIGWIVGIVKGIGNTCCGLIFIIGYVFTAVFCFYILRKKSLKCFTPRNNN